MPTADHPPEGGSTRAGRPTPPGGSSASAIRSSTPGPRACNPGLAPRSWVPHEDHNLTAVSAVKPNHRDPRCSVQRTGTAHREVPRGLPRRTRWSRWAAGLGDTAPSSQGQLCRGCWSEPCRGAEQEQTARPRGFCPPTAAGMQRRLCSPSTPSEGKGKTSSHGFHEAHTSPTANFSQGPGGQSGETGGRSVSREQATGLPRPSPPAHQQDDSAESQQGLVLHTPHHRDAEIPAHRERATVTSLPLTLVSSKTI